jgi:hypothetical protein
MSSEATHYVRRHVRGITLVERAVLLTIADRCSARGDTPRGRGPSNKTLALELEVSVRTVEEWVPSLVKKKVLIVPGRCTFVIPGVAEHDPEVCGHGECAKAALSNPQDAAGKHRQVSSLSRRMLRNNPQDAADKTFSPTERDRAARASGSAPRDGATTNPPCELHAGQRQNTCGPCRSERIGQ